VPGTGEPLNCTTTNNTIVCVSVQQKTIHLEEDELDKQPTLEVLSNHYDQLANRQPNTTTKASDMTHIGQLKFFLDTFDA
jgi:hypothetical protein